MALGVSRLLGYLLRRGQRREQELGSYLKERYGPPVRAGADRVWRVR